MTICDYIILVLAGISFSILLIVPILMEYMDDDNNDFDNDKE